MTKLFARVCMLGLVLFVLLASISAIAQPPEKYLKITISPERPDWQYQVGEKIKFQVSVLLHGNPVPDAKVRYEVMPEKMKAVKSGPLSLKDGRTTIDGNAMSVPGFLQCWVYAELEGKEYSGMGTAGVEPLKIQPTTDLPKDFVAFWENAKAEAAKIPMDARVTLLPERCTEKVNVYQVNLQNFRVGSRFYGILCVPKAPGKYPALLRVPGAGVRGYNGDIGMAERGMITLEVGIHGIPLNMDAKVYTDLGSSALNGYWAYNLDDRDRYYYKRVYLGCVRAIDYIFSMPEFDGEKLAVTGGSQGGALSIITAGLDSRVKWLSAVHPALCDLVGYLHGRAGGWPHMFDDNNKAFNVKPDKIETSKYYDVVNFARQIKVPGYYTWGFNDVVCPPTSMYAAYNVITAPKELALALETAHWSFPEQMEKLSNWLADKLIGAEATKSK